MSGFRKPVKMKDLLARNSLNVNEMKEVYKDVVYDVPFQGESLKVSAKKMQTIGDKRVSTAPEDAGERIQRKSGGKFKHKRD